jgi:hypothetical protein
MLRDAEITEFDQLFACRAICQEDIRRFQVEMHDAERMRAPQARAYVMHEPKEFTWFEHPPITKHRRQTRTVHQFHGEEWQ